MHFVVVLPYGRAEKCSAKETSDEHGRKILGRAEKGSEQLKNARHSRNNTRGHSTTASSSSTTTTATTTTTAAAAAAAAAATAAAAHGGGGGAGGGAATATSVIQTHTYDTIFVILKVFFPSRLKLDLFWRKVEHAQGLERAFI